MAQTVGTVSTHVNGTTAAVVAMKAAVVQAEKEGADHVCEKVNKGFYTLIRSQISQKIATLRSEVDSQLMRLNQQRKQLTAIRQRMERDYQMICGRYLKLFTTINKNLEQRIAELDRPVMDLAESEADKVTNRASRLTADIPLGQSESVRTAQVVSASNLKFKALKAIETIDRFIAGSNELEEVTEQILLRRRVDGDRPEANWTVPVIISESNFDATDMSQPRSYLSKIELPPEARKRIDYAVDAVVRGGELQWRGGDRIAPELISEFRSLVAQSGLDPRRQQTITGMFEAHPFQTL